MSVFFLVFAFFVSEFHVESVLKKDLSKVYVAPEFSMFSNSVRRGAVLDSNPSFEPSIHFGLLQIHQSDIRPKLFRPHINVGLGKVSSHVFLSDALRVQLGIEFFSGKEALAWIEHHESIHQRAQSIEIQTRLDYQVLPRWLLSVGFQKEINRKQHQYLDIDSEWIFWRSPRSFKKDIRLSGGVQIGLGDHAHHRYLYGSSSYELWSHYRSHVKVDVRDVFRHFDVIVQCSRSSLLGENRHSDWPSQKRDAFTFGVTARYTIF